MYAKDLIRGTIRTIVLKLLQENGKMYGYQITQKVKEVSKGEIALTYGALYPTLHKLESEGFLKTQTREVNNRLRKYYLLTAKGKKAAKIKVEEYASFANIMNQLILSRSK